MKTLDEKTLAEAIKKIALKEDCVWGCWNGGNYNVKYEYDPQEGTFYLYLKSFMVEKFNVFIESLSKELVDFSVEIKEYSRNKQNQEPYYVYKIIQNLN